MTTSERMPIRIEFGFHTERGRVGEFTDLVGVAPSGVWERCDGRSFSTWKWWVCATDEEENSIRLALSEFRNAMILIESNGKTYLDANATEVFVGVTVEASENLYASVTIPAEAVSAVASLGATISVVVF